MKRKAKGVLSAGTLLVALFFTLSLSTISQIVVANNEPIPNKEQIFVQTNLDEAPVSRVYGTQELDQRRMELESQLEKAGPFREEGNYREAIDIVSAVTESAEKIFGLHHPITLRYSSLLADLYGMQGEYVIAETRFTEVLLKQEKVLGPSDPETIVSLEGLARLYRVWGRYENANKIYIRILNVKEKIWEENHPSTLKSTGELAVLHQAMGRFESAKSLLQGAFEISEEAYGFEHEVTRVLATNLGNLYYRRGKYNRAEKLLDRAREAYEDSYGSDHPDVLRLSGYLAKLYQAQVKIADAEVLFHQVVEVSRTSLGTEHKSTLEAIVSLAGFLTARGRYGEAEKKFDRVLEVREKILGSDHPLTLVILNYLADIFSLQGRYNQAEIVSERVLSASKRKLGSVHFRTLTTQRILASIYKAQGKYSDAVGIYESILIQTEDLLGIEHPIVQRCSNDLANLYTLQGRYPEAETILENVLAVHKKAFGSEHPRILKDLANLYVVQQRYDEAEPLLDRALEAGLKILGEEHPVAVQSLRDLAIFYRAQRLYLKAEPLFLRALDIRQRILGVEHPASLQSMHDVATIEMSQGRLEKAGSLFKAALKSQNRVLGRNHPNTLYSANSLAAVYEVQNRFGESTPLLKRVLVGLSGNSFILGSDGAVAELVRLNMLRDTVFPNVAFSLLSDGYSSDQRLSLLDASFVALQRINGTSVGADIVQASARASEGDAGLAALVERLEEVSIDVRRVEAELEFAANLTASAERDERLARLKGELETATERARGIAGEIRESYPDYAELALPQGLSAEDVGDLLDEGEAVVSYAFVGKDEEEFLLAIVALPDGSLELFKLDVTKAAIEERVSKLREGVALPSGESFDASTLALDLAFDMSAAEELYGDLFRPLEEYLGASDHVIVVADGPLESLPFNLLVRSQASTNGSDEDLFSVYRDAEWLIDRYAISSVPSISSLKALRDRGAPEGDLPFLGIGHPSLEGKTTQTAANDNNDDADVIKRITLGLGDTVDVKRVKELSPVPQTAGMLQALAAALNADGSHVLLRDDAEERDLRALEKDKTLKEYQTIAFGTHALIARELRQVGLNEPALVLSPPANDTEEYDPNNDGLLRASEVVGLTLDADWVLLTACNTAAPDGTLGCGTPNGPCEVVLLCRRPLAPGLPLACGGDCHCPSCAPAMIQETNHGSSKAQALRQAMRQMKQDTTCGPNAPSTQTCPENAHPALWATFTISGDAG